MPQTPNVIANPEAMLEHMKQILSDAQSKGLKVTELETQFIQTNDVPTLGPSYAVGDTRIRLKV